MIIVDTNLLLYAYNSTSPHHEGARAWLEEVFSGGELVGLPWTVILGFIRIATDPRAHLEPLTVAETVNIVSEWLARPNVMALPPGHRHWEIVQRLLVDGQARGPLAMDAHIAAHALEHGATLATNDRDFARFEGLKLTNPVRAPD